MSANIDSMLYVGEVPWHGMGVDLTKNPPRNSYEIAAAAGIDWDVNFEKLNSEKLGHIPNYNAIYRTDNNCILGVVNKRDIKLVQNSDMFGLVDNMVGVELTVETAASLGSGDQVFGCFRVAEEYKILDDDVVHYFVIMNDHLKCNGTVTILNTPVRVVCQNTLMEALKNNIYSMPLNVYSNKLAASAITENIVHNMENSIKELQGFADRMVDQKIDKLYVENILDRLFPYQKVDSQILMTRANDKVAYKRDLFLSRCMDADDLQNYKGTKWQVFNAITDFSQHYYSSAKKAYSVEGRMGTVKGFVRNGANSLVTEYLRVA